MRIYYKVMAKSEISEGYVKSNGSTEFETEKKAVKIARDYADSIFTNDKKRLIIEKHTVTEMGYYQP